ncbi:ribonuclease H [Senna tora]|uniref:Ribonuclease H n=1 Tax=Senna tora TaxID=362788 RepID=A0A834W608_9FABA|nr:ribonuclease H [Senna tora]
MARGKLSSEESDLCARSNKKVKTVGEQGDPIELLLSGVQPHDSGGDQGRGLTPEVQGFVSFKDKLCSTPTDAYSAGDEQMSLSESESSSSDEESEAESEEEGGLDIPVLEYSQEEYDQWCLPWRLTLLVTLMGKRVGVTFMRNRLEKLWQSKGQGISQIIDLENAVYSALVDESAVVACFLELQVTAPEPRDLNFLGGVSSEELSEVDWDDGLLFSAPQNAVTQLSFFIWISKALLNQVPQILRLKQSLHLYAPELIILTIEDGNHGNEVTKIVSWIRVPNLPLEFYNARCLARRVRMAFDAAQSVVNPGKDPPTRASCIVKWQKPNSDWLKVNVDGASKLDSSQRASCGGVARDHSGHFVAGFVKNLGSCNALHAELWSVMMGLDLAWEIGARKVVIEVDSLLAHQLIYGQVPDLHPCASLVANIHHLIARNWAVEISHVLREANKVADAMAGCAPGGSLELVRFNHPPSGVVHLLEEDLNGSGTLRACVV